MKKLLFTTCFTLFLAGCNSPVSNVQQTNLSNKNNVSSEVSKSNKEIKFSFKLLDAQSLSRIKSVDAYLVNDINSPLLPASNIYSNLFKYQANVTNGVISVVFTGFPSGGPYYMALQAFDNTVGSSPRNNITAFDTTVVSGDTQVSRSTNSVSYNSGVVTYSDSTGSLNLTIKLIPFNTPPLNITPENGSNTPTNGISLG